MSSANPIVSVVLPAYNAEKYIRSAVLSIVEQTYKDIELIVIDDGSKDGTLKILSDLQKEDSRIKIISRENRGLVKSLNEGVAAARGAWIARMDADDISTPNRIQRQIIYAEENKLDLCGSYVRTFGFCRSNIRRYPITPAGANLQLAFNTCFAHPTIIARAKILKENPYSEIFDKIEDYELWTRLATKGFRLGNIPETLLHYRRTFSQATSIHRGVQDKMRIAIATEFTQNILPQLPSDMMLALLNRTTRIEGDTVMCAAHKLHELIIEGQDVENVILENLKIFLMHNCVALSGNAWGQLKTLLPARSLFLILALRIVGFHSGHKLWNLLYLLK